MGEMKCSQYHGILAHIMLLGLAYGLVNEETTLVYIFSFLIVYNGAALIFIILSNPPIKQKEGAVSRNKSK